MSAPPTAIPGPTSGLRPARLDSIDLLRGLIMVVMALDHVRDFFHFSAIHGIDPLDLSRTTAPIFLTRWVTHFCAPIFSFLAGVGVFLAVMRGKPKRDLSRFLLTRGLWLIFLELTLLVWFGWDFEINVHRYFFATLWSLGWSMIVLAGLIHCPMRTVAAFSLLLILGHNALDAVKPESWGAWAWLWKTLHVQSGFAIGPVQIFTFYPLVPWLGVMSAGYWAGQLYQLDAVSRQKWLLRLGWGLTAAFVLLRFANFYGNLTPWFWQSTPLFSLLSFLDCTKYPPSLCYLLMTLGPGLLMLALFERRTVPGLQPLIVFGRVPFFYYVLHIPVVHALAWLMHKFRHGEVGFSLVSGTPPPDAGVGLVATYAVWIVVVLALYPACRWFADLKRRRKDAWLSYL